MFALSQSLLHDWRAVPTARSAALSFLSTSGGPMRAAALARRAEVLGVDAAALRVALGRLVREGIARSPERGSYAIGATGAAMNALARGWRGIEARVRDWDGRWLLVGADHLGRSDRPRLRLRERALRLGGFAPAPAGLWVRADNLAEPLDVTAARLVALGLDAEALVIGEAAVLADRDAAFRAAWDRSAIEAGYRFWIAEMAASAARVATLPLEPAARETLLLGQAVIRAINLDPLLPAELVDTGLRRALLAAMEAYDRTGRALWARID